MPIFVDLRPSTFLPLSTTVDVTPLLPASLSEALVKLIGGCFVISGEFRIELFRLTTFLISSCGSCCVLPLTRSLVEETPASILLLAFALFCVDVCPASFAFDVAVLFDGFVMTLVGMLENAGKMSRVGCISSLDNIGLFRAFGPCWAW